MVKGRRQDTPAVEDASLGDAADKLLTKMGEDALPTKDDDHTKDGPPEPLQLARRAYESSTDFVDSSLRSQWERNERAFYSRHASGSKYLSSKYKTRSRLYRPKTRHMIRSGEAQIAASYFSSQDVIAVTPWNPSDKKQVATAELQKEILQYRLTSPSQKVGIPWFQTVVGAYQDAAKYGSVVSKQWWEYTTREEPEMVGMQDEFGNELVDENYNPILEQKMKTIVVRDRPHVDLIPIENVRVDRGASWLDPINSSPYCIILYPMYVYEVEERMKEQPGKSTAPPWHQVDRTRLRASADDHNWDSTRSHREGSRQDSRESEIQIDEYSIVWVHENFMRWENRDYVWWTSGVNDLLSDPVPTEEAYLHADEERPLVMGNLLIETHKVYPSGKPEIVQELQREANDIANLRIDNIKLALMKRFLVRRGKQVDLRSLLRASPGAITLVSDIEGDVKEMETRDVTGGSFQEQDRINADFDDLAGVQSAQGTIASNRRMNETVGGMQLMAGAANNIGELDLRVITETWTERVLRQLINMERHYESDTTLIAIAADKAQLFERHGISQINDQMMNQEAMVKVNVGIGATDPMQRLEKFMIGAKAIGEIFGEEARMLADFEEFAKEIFGPLGYRDGQRFFKLGEQDPQVQMLQKKLEELQDQLDKRIVDVEGKKAVAQILGQSRQSQQELENKGNMDTTQLEGMVKMMIQKEMAASSERQTEAKGSSDLTKENARNMANVIQEMMKQAGANEIAQSRPEPRPGNGTASSE